MKRTILLPLSFFLLFALPGQAAASESVKVMTRNLYLGADLLPLAIYGSDPAQLDNFSKTVSWVWGNVQKTKWNTRVRGLAKELKTVKPDLVGLQEAALWRKSRTPTGATTVVAYDYLGSLVKEADHQGIKYRVLASHDEFDITVPTSLGFRLRFTQRDAILVRVGSGIALRSLNRGRFNELFSVDTPAGKAISRRGWISADLRTRGHKDIRFVTTHLEAYGDAIRNQQAIQLGATDLATSKPTILVGDINSDPQDTGAPGDAYRSLISAGMKDAFASPIATDGQDTLLNNPVSKLSHWIDHIMTKNGSWSTLSSGRVGDKVSDKVGGLWPSDHAGLWARLSIG